MAQYTSKSAITVFTTLAYFAKSALNTEPKADQHSVNVKPINANSMENPSKIKVCPL